MEESKVNAAEDINVPQLDKNQIIDECTGDYLLGEKTGIKEIILNAMDRWLEQESTLLQSHITKLEDRNKELVIAGQKLLGFVHHLRHEVDYLPDSYYEWMNKVIRETEELFSDYEEAEQALKKK